MFFVFILAFVSLSKAKIPTNGSTLDIPNNIKCCKCVPFYACKNNTIDENHVENTDSSEAVFNVQFCSNHIDFCCLLPNHQKECDLYPLLKNLPSAVNKTPRPDLLCNCTFWKTCPLDMIVADGKGKSNTLFEDIGLVPHSKCAKYLDVCCTDNQPFTKAVHAHSDALISTESRDSGCRCVDMNRCQSSSLFGEGVIEPRDRTRSSSKEACRDNSQVCCPLLDITDGGVVAGASSIHLHKFVFFSLLMVFVQYF